VKCRTEKTGNGRNLICQRSEATRYQGYIFLLVSCDAEGFSPIVFRLLFVIEEEFCCEFRHKVTATYIFFFHNNQIIDKLAIQPEAKRNILVATVVETYSAQEFRLGKKCQNKLKSNINVLFRPKSFVHPFPVISQKLRGLFKPLLPL
jgi:hypothetical protein